jgi:hypothetical protein
MYHILWFLFLLAGIIAWAYFLVAIIEGLTDFFRELKGGQKP